MLLLGFLLFSDRTLVITFPEVELGHLVGDAFLFSLEALDELRHHLIRHFADVVGDLLADERLLLTTTTLKILLHEVTSTVGDNRALVG